MSGSTFRSQCKLCSEIFFANVKDSPYCGRCAKRIGYRPPRPPKLEHAPQPAPETHSPAISQAPLQPAAQLQTVTSIEAAKIHPPATSSRELDQPGNRESQVRRLAPPRGAPGPAVGQYPRHAGASDQTPAPPHGGRGQGPGRPAGTHHTHLPDARGGSVPTTRKPATAKPTEKDVGPGIKEPVKLTDSLRQSILHATEYYADDPAASLREVIDRVCVEFGVDRQTVHLIASPVYSERLRRRSRELAPGQRDAVGERYEQMILKGERPIGGRRKQIARELQIPYAAVMTAVAYWGWRHQDPRQLSRDQKYHIEQDYFRRILASEWPPDPPALMAAPPFQGARIALSDLAAQISANLHIHSLGVSRWIDQLHDDLRALDRIDPVTPEIMTGLLKAYGDYLAGDVIPADSLHKTLGEKFGCSVRQVHRTLLLFRWDLRVQRLDCDESLVEMVRRSREIMPILPG